MSAIHTTPNRRAGNDFSAREPDLQGKLVALAKDGDAEAF